MVHKTILAIVLFISVFTVNNATAQQGSYGKMAADILVLVNQHRAGKGLSPLTANAIIVQAAQQHSNNMAAGSIPFGHDGFDDRMNKLAQQIHPATGFAENVAYGAKTAQEAVDMWLHSEGHRKNIEGSYNLTGIGIAKGADGNLYFTQIFLYKK